MNHFSLTNVFRVTDSIILVFFSHLKMMADYSSYIYAINQNPPSEAYWRWLWWHSYNQNKLVLHYTNTNIILLSHVWLFVICGLQQARLPCPSPSPRVCSDSCPLSQWPIPPSHPLLPSSSFAFSLSQHQGLFQWLSSSWIVSSITFLHFHLFFFQWTLLWVQKLQNTN